MFQRLRCVCGVDVKSDGGSTMRGDHGYRDGKEGVLSTTVGLATNEQDYSRAIGFVPLVAVAFGYRPSGVADTN